MSNVFVIALVYCALVHCIGATIFPFITMFKNSLVTYVLVTQVFIQSSETYFFHLRHNLVDSNLC